MPRREYPDAIQSPCVVPREIMAFKSRLRRRRTPGWPCSSARHRVNIRNRAWQRQRGPTLSAILCAEDLALVARADVDLLGVGLVQSDRHDRAVHLHLVEALPGPARVLAAIDASVVARRG